MFNSFRPPSSIYHNKVSSALYVAESSGKESQIQGVQILMKDDEKVPMTGAQQFSPSNVDDVTRVATSAEAASADSAPAVAAPADVNQAVIVKQEMAKPEIHSSTATSTSTTTSTATTTSSTTTASINLPGLGLAKPEPDNSGLIGHIQKLLELNTSMMETIQAQLAAQANILKSIIEGSISSREHAS